MRKIICSTYATLDGFIDDPHLWSMQHNSEDAMAYALELTLGCDALLLGRVTYEGMAQAWPNMGGNPYADHVNAIAKYAVSSTLDEPADWNNSSIIPGDRLVAEVTELKRRPGADILIWGCGRLTDDLAAHGLLDEYRIWIYPVLKGEGEPLFRKESAGAVELTGTRTFDSGVVVLTYRPATAGGDAPAAG
ncbi:dihydrofolate reductase family protein [Planomonospora sp. ID91781]|uniref:Deaminase reductase n=1 Tax=Planomonospora sphaerica TaxID=161355 RepID=A0A171DG75_9ACTN|nr:MULTISPECIES: dihydrofolate reductase family protein [Planomonospora]MBG0824680.1 dihydrofolate reductase family protein [Planomonospora sp. ID91781]GAT68318.1 deaminase reductase [Planomonospora sphaerica]